MRRILGGGVLLILTAGLALANPPNYAQPAVAAVVPVYTAVHGQQQQSLEHAELLVAIQQLAVEVKALREELAAIRQAQQEAIDGPAVLKAEPALAAAQICARCHAPSRAEEKGGGFALFADDKAGGFAPLNPRDRRRVAARVANGTMPPPKAGALGPDEQAALIEFFK